MWTHHHLTCGRLVVVVRAGRVTTVPGIQLNIHYLDFLNTRLFLRFGLSVEYSLPFTHDHWPGTVWYRQPLTVNMSKIYIYIFCFIVYWLFESWNGVLFTRCHTVEEVLIQIHRFWSNTNADDFMITCHD